MSGPEDIRAGHCTNCGRYLLGSARVDFESIQWVGREAATILRAVENNTAFGFTGTPSYQINAPVPNVWLMETPSAAALPTPQSGGSASAAHYFAPERPGLASSTAQYLAQTPPQSPATKNVAVQGEGVADNENTPAITLDIAVRGASKQEPCSGQAQCDELQVPGGGVITFVVTPRINPGLVPPGVSPVEYVVVEVLAMDKVPGSRNSDLSFVDRCPTPNSFLPRQFFHCLHGGGPNRMPVMCTRQVTFMASPNHSFEYQISNQRDTDKGYVEYTFVIRGHYDPNNPARWPGSRKTFRVKTSGGMAVSRQRREITWPPLGNAKFYDPKSGATQETPMVIIAGGVELGGSVLGAGASFRQNEAVNIGAKIHVFSAHIGLNAESVAVLAYQRSAMHPMKLTCLDMDGSFKPITGTADLKPCTRGTLKHTLDIDMINGEFTQPPGIYNVYFGYRMADGTLIFNGKSVNFIVHGA
ncbi:MAG: hypothetical protein GY862_22780 [Gammaproteobacteria bacterium]|nr:hypothetical protein [Gammaproteobacteria bacterium]